MLCLVAALGFFGTANAVSGGDVRLQGLEDRSCGGHLDTDCSRCTPDQQVCNYCIVTVDPDPSDPRLGCF